MAIESINEYLTAGKAAIDIFKSVKAGLPKGEASDKVGAQIATAERAFKASEAELAKKLGYKLCRCSFPPEIMLWNKDHGASFCPKCNDRNPVRIDPDEEPGDWVSARFF